jgi:hypothetical protein
MPKKKSVMARVQKMMRPKGKAKKRMLDNPWGRGRREKRGMVDAIAGRAGGGTRFRRRGLPGWAAVFRAPTVEHYIEGNDDPDGVARAERRDNSFFAKVINFFETWRPKFGREDD